MSFCNECGECFHRCPVMELPLKVAQKEINRLKNGKISRYVLNRCETCFSCDIICPLNFNPSQLIIERYKRIYEKSGIFIRAKYFQPHEKLNFRTYVVERLPDEEKKILKEWANLTPVEEFCYPGCNVCTVPYLTQTSILKDIEIRGGLQYCCGETYYRTGMLEILPMVNETLQNYFKKLKAKKMLILCTAGFNMFTNILPKFGKRFPLEITPLLVWLWEKIKKGKIKIKNKLNIKVTIQDSCHSKIFGKEYLELPRFILDYSGVKIVEMKHSKEYSLCCGIAAGFPPESSYSPIDIMFSTFKRLKEAKNTQAEAIVTYCAGCLQMLSVGKILYPLKMPVYHILEILQMAIGEEPLKREKQRAKTFLRGVIIHQLPKVFSKKKYKIYL